LFKSGFIGIIGRPNVGKSTLLNTLIGERIAITTPKPQTTRNRIMGIKNLDDGQLIFVDTPGIHKASSPLNEYMISAAMDTFRSTDSLLLIVDANAGVHPGDRMILNALENIRIPVMLIINKIDLLQRDLVLPVIDQFRQLFSFAEIVPISALHGDGVSILVEQIKQLLPEGPRYFPEDMMTDSTERFIVAETVREKITLLTRQEIPYETAVIVDSFKEIEEKNLIRIQATITVAKDSQKGILIGKKGGMLKEIGKRARMDIEKFFASKVYLELFVRVKKDWIHDPKMLRELGYTEKK
jgi:GTP-binding protein Era